MENIGIRRGREPNTAKEGAGKGMREYWEQGREGTKKRARRRRRRSKRRRKYKEDRDTVT